MPPTHYPGTDGERRALDTYIKLFRAADTVSHRASKSISAAGLTLSQFGALETLYHLGPMMVCRLAEKHLKSRNNFTTVVDNLEKAGYVARGRDPEDRRAIIVELTPKGREVIERVLPGHVSEVVDAFANLTPSEQTLLGDLLRKLGKGSVPLDPEP
ncbi:MAG: MarR family transcriptional regulator [Fimbriimonadales bacterium]